MFSNIKAHRHVSSENIVCMISKILMKIYLMIFACVFDPGGIKLSKLWALKKPLDLMTDLFKRKGMMNVTLKGYSIGPTPRPIPFNFLLFS